MYKVGQRVWVKSDKCFGVVESIQEYQTTNDLATLTTQELRYAVTFDDGKGTIFKETDLHETSDDMFENLGYEKVITIESTLQYRSVISRSRVYIFVNEATKDYLIGDKLRMAVYITPEFHQAIHQKGIELGWWE